MPRGTHARGVRRGLAAFCLGSFLASPAAGQPASDLAAALDNAISSAESSLQRGDLEAAEGRYREALLEGWLLMATMHRAERRLPEAREALRNASAFASENREALQSLAIAQLQSGDDSEAV